MDAVVTAVELGLAPRLRELALPLGVATKDAAGQSRKLAALNDDLRKAGAYDETDRAQVEAWLKLRNDVAHAQDQAITDAKVAATLAGVRVFLDEHPA